MKQLRKSILSLALAVVLACSVVPFSVSAEEQCETISLKAMETKENVAYAGFTYKLYVTNYGAAMEIDSWKSSNTNVIKVSKYDSKYGKMQTLKAGKANVYAYVDGDKVATFNFNVKSSMSFSTKSPTVEKGSTKTVKATISATNVTSGTFKASSSDKSVCTVSVSSTGSKTANIKIKGIKAGTATVKVSNSASTEKVSLKVTVKKPSVMSVSTKSVSVKKGSSSTVKASLTKSGTVKASSANTAVATAKVTKVDSKNYKIAIKGVKVGSTTITVKNSINSEKITIKVTVTSATAKTVRRAVVIAQRYEGTSSELEACEKDGTAMKLMLKQTGYSEVATIREASVSKMKNTIASTFKNADSDDVSLVYYTGHGASDGSLCGFTGSSIETVSPATVAGWLKKIPGKVIFLCDSCYSGQFINKGGDPEYASQQLVKAFAENNSVIKSGVMCTSKFQVLTACNKYEYSYCNSEYGYFTKALTDGAGFSYSGNKRASAPADKNSDKKLSLQECYKYAYKKCSPKQTPVCYPSNSSFQIFKR